MTHCFGNPLTTALFSRLETHEPDPRNGRETPGRHQVHAFQGNPFGQALRRAREDGSFAINTAELDRYKAANEHRFQETRKEAASVSPLETPSDPVTETAIRGRLELEAKQKQAEASQRQLVDRPRRPFQRVQGEVGAAGEGLALMVLQLPCRVAPSLPPACDTQTLKTKGDYSYDNNARPGGSGPDRRKRMGAARRAVAGAGHHAQ